MRAAGSYYATGPFAGPYAAQAAMSNANIITVFAGGDDPTDHRVAADAMRAYGWILSSGMPDLRTDAKYQVVPRMPDGTQIGATEMRVLAATAQNATFSYTGDNVFVYDRGIGRNKLNGTAGADVLIDNSSKGGDRLAGKGGDDYLIGGKGTNVFVPGDGNDYALIRGGAARFQVSAASAGRLEIEGFRPGTDIIALTGITSLAAILASARSDGFGGTLLTISPQRTIRLNGLAPSKITGALFDISALPSDMIFGTAGPDTLVGTLGANTMVGGAGDDIYVVNNAGDIVTESAGEGTDTVRSSITYSLPTYVENLVLAGTGNINATGNKLANLLTGNSGNNILDGKGGVDTMSGGAGNDTYYVDYAGDRVLESKGEGVDKVFSSVSYGLTGQYIEDLTLTGDADLYARGNAHDNVLIGNSGDNYLAGRGGADILTGGGGSDIFRLTSTLVAGDFDTITDFDVAEDMIMLRLRVFNTIVSKGPLSAGEFIANASGTAQNPNHRIIYESDTGRLYYDSNGSAAGGSAQIGKLDAGLALTANYFSIF